jgi:hypothetical protein
MDVGPDAGGNQPGEWDELAAIEGPENVRPLLDPWDDDAYDDEDG